MGILLRGGGRKLVHRAPVRDLHGVDQSDRMGEALRAPAASMLMGVRLLSPGAINP